ncbi:2294_t:CDS:2, partial [Dentiscutata erythropus]
SFFDNVSGYNSMRDIVLEGTKGSAANIPTLHPQSYNLTNLYFVNIFT